MKHLLLPLLILTSGCTAVSNDSVIKDSSDSAWVSDGPIFEEGQTFVLTINNKLQGHGIQGATLLQGREVPWIIIRQPRSRYDTAWLRILEHEGRHAAGRPFIKHNGVNCPCTGYEGGERFRTNEN